jgi:hypothetical protein
VIEAKQDKTEYDITFELPNAGLLLTLPMSNVTAEDNAATHSSVDQDVPLSWNTPPQQYPLRLCGSVVGNQPYDTYAPQMQFLQLEEVRVHRSALGAIEEQRNQISSKQTHVMILVMVNIDTTEHNIDEELTTGCKQEVAVWPYLMTQYILKPGLQKFGESWAKAAVSELTQLHIMDTWTVMDPE